MKFKYLLPVVAIYATIFLLPKIQSLLNPIKITITEVRYDRAEIFIDISITNLQSTTFPILSTKDIIFSKQFSFIYSTGIWKKQNLEFIIWHSRFTSYDYGERIFDEVKSGETKFFTLRLNDYVPGTYLEKPGGNLYCYLSLKGGLKSRYDGTCSNRITLREIIE